MKKATYIFFNTILLIIACIIITSCDSLWRVDSRTNIAFKIDMTEFFPEEILKTATLPRYINGDNRAEVTVEITASLINSTNAKKVASATREISLENFYSFQEQFLFEKVASNSSVYATITAEIDIDGFEKLVPSSFLGDPTVFNARSEAVVVEKNKTTTLVARPNTIFVGNDPIPTPFATTHNLKDGLTPFTAVQTIDEAIKALTHNSKLPSNAIIYLMDTMNLYNDSPVWSYPGITFKRYRSLEAYDGVLINITKNPSTSSSSLFRMNNITIDGNDEIDDDTNMTFSLVSVDGNTGLVLLDSTFINNEDDKSNSITLFNGAFLQLTSGPILIEDGIEYELDGRGTSPVSVHGNLQDSSIVLKPSGLRNDYILVKNQFQGSLDPANFEVIGIDDDNAIRVNNYGDLYYYSDEVPSFEIFVGGSNADDINNDGSESQPVQTVTKALELLGKLGGGTIFLNEPVNITNNTTWATAYNDASYRAVISPSDSFSGSTLISVGASTDFRITELSIDGKDKVQALIAIGQSFVTIGNVTADGIVELKGSIGPAITIAENADALILDSGIIKIADGISYFLTGPANSTVKVNTLAEGSDIVLNPQKSTLINEYMLVKSTTNEDFLEYFSLQDSIEGDIQTIGVSTKDLIYSVISPTLDKVYVGDSSTATANNSNDGSEDSPVVTIERALEILDSNAGNGIIYLHETYTTTANEKLAPTGEVTIEPSSDFNDNTMINISGSGVIIDEILIDGKGKTSELLRILDNATLMLRNVTLQASMTNNIYFTENAETLTLEGLVKIESIFYTTSGTTNSPVKVNRLEDGSDIVLIPNNYTEVHGHMLVKGTLNEDFSKYFTLGGSIPGNIIAQGVSSIDLFYSNPPPVPDQVFVGEYSGGPTANDANDGSENTPVATITKALELLTGSASDATIFLNQPISTISSETWNPTRNVTIEPSDNFSDSSSDDYLINHTSGNLTIRGINFNANSKNISTVIKVEVASLELENIDLLNDNGTGISILDTSNSTLLNFISGVFNIPSGVEFTAYSNSASRIRVNTALSESGENSNIVLIPQGLQDGYMLVDNQISNDISSFFSLSPTVTVGSIVNSSFGNDILYSNPPPVPGHVYVGQYSGGPTAKDTKDGSESAPVATMTRALEILDNNHGGDGTIYFNDTYDVTTHENWTASGDISIEISANFDGQELLYMTNPNTSLSVDNISIDTGSHLFSGWLIFTEIPLTLNDVTITGSTYSDVINMENTTLELNNVTINNTGSGSNGISVMSNSTINLTGGTISIPKGITFTPEVSTPVIEIPSNSTLAPASNILLSPYIIQASGSYIVVKNNTSTNYFSVFELHPDLYYAHELIETGYDIYVNKN